MKKIISVILYIMAALLSIAFAVSLYIDYTEHYLWGSAPFYVYVLERFAEFMIAAIVCLILGVTLQLKGRS